MKTLGQSVFLKLCKTTFVLLLGLVAAATTILLFATQSYAAESFPLYSWGNSSNGRLGRVVTIDNPAYRPARVEGATNWVSAATASGGSFAISGEGHLYAWGNFLNAENMGQGGTGSGPITTPTRIGTANNWVQVSARASNVAAINSAGHLYVWGTNASALRPGSNSVPIRVESAQNWTSIATGSGSAVFAINAQGQLFSASRVSPDSNLLGRGGSYYQMLQVGTASNWVEAVHGGTYTFAINSQGHLYSWGLGGSGRLGLGNQENQPTPQRVGSNTWRTVRTVTMSGVAISTTGHLYSWGWNHHGQLGLGLEATEIRLSPQRIGNASNWTTLFGGEGHVFAFNTSRQLFAWGNNSHGQLGIGEADGSRNVPTYVATATGFSTAAAGGGNHSMMLMRIAPAIGDFDLTKALQKPYGTPRPGPLTFEFNMVAYSFNNNTDPAIINANFPITPTLDSRNITRYVTINAASESEIITDASGNIVELTSSTDILEGIEFSRRGVYTWIISELPTTTPAVNSPSNVVFSQAQYELRVYVRQREVVAGEEFYIYAITVHRLRNADGTIPTNGRQKVGMNDEAEITFTNRYTRLTSANQHLNVTKYIEGNFANTDETFTFTATLTRHSFCQIGATPIVARVFNQNNVEVATHNFTTANPTVANITLSHNWRLVFDPITIGSSFVVIEAACPLHIARVRVYSHAHPTIPQLLENTVVGQPRTTNTHIIGANTNAANFINAHQYVPPTGLFLGTPTYVFIPLFGVGIAVAASFATKARKRIEDMPVMH